MLVTLDGMARVGLFKEVVCMLRNEELGIQHAKSQGKSNPGRTQATVLVPRVSNRTSADMAR